jgi:putative transposase
MGLPRSTFYDAPSLKADDAEIIANMITICDEFETYGYRRISAELRHRGILVNSKKIRRLMREHGLQHKRRKRFVATTDGDHDGPIFPDLAHDRMVDGPNQLWVADITYIAIGAGFVYLAAILDAWSRRVVGICDQSLDRRTSGNCSTEGRYSSPAAAQGLHPSLGSRFAICLRGLPQAARRAWVRRLDGPAWKPLRQRQGRKLHQDAEGRCRLPDGLRNSRGRHRGSSPLH